MKNIKSLLLLIALSLFLFIVACSTNEEQQADAESEAEGEEAVEESATKDVLNIALNAQPVSLDPPMQAETATRDTANLMFETLVAPNSNYEAVPMLAESIDISDDSQTYTFHLREGVKFHNGKEMIAEDVVASMERWMELSTFTGTVFDDAVFKEVDDYTVELRLAKPSALTLDIMAGQKRFAAIMPKEVVDSTPADGIQEYIGTGPYKFVEWKQDQYIHFTKFDDYKPVDLEANGISGKKEALIEDIYFHIVTDPATRLAGLQTGEYDIMYQVPADNFEQIKNDPNLVLHINKSGGSAESLFYNREEGIAADFKIREAINTALDMEKIMLAAFSDEEHFWLDAGYMNRYVSNWESDAGSEYYNQNDPEKAKEILEEAGYDGELFRILTTRDTEYMYNEAVVIQEQLRDIGMNVELEVTDWATVVNKVVDDPKGWDSYITGISPVSTPPQVQFVSRTFAGGVDEVMDELLKDLEVAPTLEEAQQIWNEIQGHSWENHLPASILGYSASLTASTDKVEGFNVEPSPIFWNTIVKE